jgi:ABC-2 type transport system ATP-binding protein
MSHPTAGQPAIDIRSLRVDYADFVAVRDLTMQVPPGEVFGLVGPNGAGKSSTFKVLATLQEPTYGEVSLCGIDILENREAARRIMGYMPDLAPVPKDLKIREFLAFYARGYHLGTQAERDARIDECLEIVSLTDKQQSWCHELSRGQTQRVVLAKTLLHRPKVLILDEPASGLDPLARRELRLAMRNIAAQGGTVFISSHILSELAEMCTSLCVMNKGSLLANGTAEEVRAQLGSTKRQLTAIPLANISAVAGWLGGQAHVEDLRATENSVVFSFAGSDEAQADLLHGLVLAGHRLRAFSEQRASFEEILVDVAESGRQKPANGTQN